jgi:hypothetical protein
VEPSAEVLIARFGRIYMRAQAELSSARRPDTPTLVQGLSVLLK